MAGINGDSYNSRLKRIENAIRLKKPDRVPVILQPSYLPARYAGMTYAEAWQDTPRWLAANKKFVTETEPDMFQGTMTQSEAVCQAIDTRMMLRPGNGAGPNSTHQFVEGEYMRADEYDAFLEDPTDFILRTYLPRAGGAFAPLKDLPNLSSFVYTGPAYGPIEIFANPALAGVFRSLQKAGQAAEKAEGLRMAFFREMDELGFPSLINQSLLPPYDHISDFLRGMRGIMLDMYRQPDKLLAAMERILGITIKMIEATPIIGKYPGLFVPLHRGADGFMSLEQFERFYWPGLKKILLAYIEKGFIPHIFWEGDYTSRLEYLLELPDGKVLNHFDRTDMAKAKEVLGGHQCIAGGMLPSLLRAGSVEDVKDRCKQLIDTCGRDGGFILATSSVLDEAKVENVRAMVDFTKEYGVY